jgi:hypothetical protein
MVLELPADHAERVVYEVMVDVDLGEEGLAQETTGNSAIQLQLPMQSCAVQFSAVHTKHSRVV